MPGEDVESHAASASNYDGALRQHLQLLKKMQPRKKRKTQQSAEQHDGQEPAKKKKRKLAAAEQKPPPQKGAAVECSMLEESAPGGTEWVQGQVHVCPLP